MRHALMPFTKPLKVFNQLQHPKVNWSETCFMHVYQLSVCTHLDEALYVLCSSMLFDLFLCGILQHSMYVFIKCVLSTSVQVA